MYKRNKLKKIGGRESGQSFDRLPVPAKNIMEDIIWKMSGV